MKFLNSILCIALPCVMLGITGSSCMEPANESTYEKLISNVLQKYEFKVGHNWWQVKIKNNNHPINSEFLYNNETYKVPFYIATVNINNDQTTTCYCIVQEDDPNTIYIPLQDTSNNYVVYLKYTTDKACKIGLQLANLYNNAPSFYELTKFQLISDKQMLINLTQSKAFQNNWIALQQAIKKNNIYNNSEMNVDSNINIINNINEINTNNINNSNFSLKSNEEISNKKEIDSNDDNEMIKILGDESDLSEYEIDNVDMNNYDINDFKLYTSPLKTDKKIKVKLWNYNDPEEEEVDLKVNDNEFVIADDNDSSDLNEIIKYYYPILGVVQYKNHYYLAGLLNNDWVFLSRSRDEGIPFLTPIETDNINKNLNKININDIENDNRNIKTNNMSNFNNDDENNINNTINNNSFGSGQQDNNMNDKQQQIENTLKQIVDNVDISYVNEPYADANREINKDSITINLLEYLYAKLFTNNKDAELGNPYKIAEIANSYILSNYDNNISFSLSEGTFDLIQYYLMQKKEMDEILTI